MVWYSHLFQNFPQFIVIHTVKSFGIVNKAEIDVFHLVQNSVLDENTQRGKKKNKNLPQISQVLGGVGQDLNPGLFDPNDQIFNHVQTLTLPVP